MIDVADEKMHSCPPTRIRIQVQTFHAPVPAYANLGIPNHSSKETCAAREARRWPTTYVIWRVDG